MSALAPTMQAFFTERLIGQRQASPHTIAAYRDTFRLLLAFAQERTGIRPHSLDVEDLDAVLVTAFLDHLELERDRGNTPGHGTPGWRRSARSTTMPRCATPSTRPRSRACSRSRPSATTARLSATSTSRKPRRCSPPPTKPAGSAGATTP
jgi:Phage integrase, N-terminal SAM-like domain